MEYIGFNCEIFYIFLYEIIGLYVIGGFFFYLLVFFFNGFNIEMWIIKLLEIFNIIKYILYMYLKWIY